MGDSQRCPACGQGIIVEEISGLVRKGLRIEGGGGEIGIPHPERAHRHHIRLTWQAIGDALG